MKALIAKHIGRKLARWYWNQVDRADVENFEPKPWGQWFIFEWWWTRPGNWSIGIKYLVCLWSRDRALSVSWSNPKETRRKALLVRALVAKLDQEEKS